MLVLNSIKNLTKPFLIFLLIGLNESITNQEPDINRRELISFQKKIYILNGILQLLIRIEINLGYV